MVSCVEAGFGSRKERIFRRRPVQLLFAGKENFSLQLQPTQTKRTSQEGRTESSKVSILCQSHESSIALSGAKIQERVVMATNLSFRARRVVLFFFAGFFGVANAWAFSGQSSVSNRHSSGEQTSQSIHWMVEGSNSLQIHRSHRSLRVVLRSEAGGSDGEFRKDYSQFVDAAKVPLLWEQLRATQKRPLLDLSAKTESVVDETGSTGDEQDLQPCEWDLGQYWIATCLELQDLGLEKLTGAAEQERYVKACPQLLRLPTSDVLETAAWLLETFEGPSIVESDPRLLSYPKVDVEYGISFLSTMMMGAMDPITSCRASPALFLSGIEGGLQERAVSLALGEASQATSKANQKIVGDAKASFQALKNRRGLGG